jgi:hypothetical protein
MFKFIKDLFSKPTPVEQPKCPVMHQPLPPKEEPAPIIITPEPAPVAVVEEVKIEVKKEEQWPFPTGVKPGETVPVAAMTAKPKPKSTSKKPVTTKTRKKK